jgi:hypothetical protein
MTRQELLNSADYWQSIAENQCYRENINCTLQLVDKKRMIEKVCKWLEQNVDKYLYNIGGYEEYIPKCGDKLFYDFKKAMQNG